MISGSSERGRVFSILHDDRDGNSIYMNIW